jgi:hypothetical protein
MIQSTFLYCLPSLRRSPASSHACQVREILPVEKPVFRASSLTGSRPVFSYENLCFLSTSAEFSESRRAFRAIASRSSSIRFCVFQFFGCRHTIPLTNVYFSAAFFAALRPLLTGNMRLMLSRPIPVA